MSANKENQFHVHRRYNARPFRRFAFTVDFDAASEDGYKIVDFDPNVADAYFLGQFANHMAQPQRDVVSGGHENGVWYTTTEDYESGTLEHYTTAVRNMPGAAIMAKGRG